MKKTIQLILFLFILSSCKVSNSEKLLPVINMESSISKMEKVYLSQFSDNIRYVPLETGPDIYFQGLWDCIFSDSLILARDLNKCVLFDHNGKSKAIIGKNGRGPGEYFNLKCADFGADSNIFIQGNMNLYEYKLDGSFVAQYNNVFRLNNNIYDVNRWKVISDSLFFGHVANSTGQIKDKALIIDKNGDIKHNYENYIVFDRERPQYGFYEDFAHIPRIRGTIYYKECFNDTLFLLNNNLELEAKYVFNLGKYKIPTSLRRSNAAIEYRDYITLFEVFQTKDFLFLRFDFGKWFPARRLTPQPSIFPGGDPVWINTVYALGIYNKQTTELIFSKPTDTDNPLFTTGLYNDIDCGPRFFPSEQVNDSTMIMKIDAKKLKEHIASDDFKNGIPKYPEKKKKLEELAEKLTEYDNQVLMFVTFRGGK